MRETPRAAGLTFVLTAATLVCFAANSLLCRLALAAHTIDAVSFTTVRLASGAIALTLIVLARRSGSLRSGSWRSALTLVFYAIPFSLAYVRIGAGVGALILFGVTQATMIGSGLMRGERPRPLVWVGLAVALGGLCILTVPGASAPDPVGAGLMVIAGLGWGVFSLLGKATPGDPIAANAGTFIRCVPVALGCVAIAALVRTPLAATSRGIVLAASSGALASGVGYSIWYAALRRLTATTAAVVQLLVPVIASAGGLVLLGENASSRLIGASAAILGGVGLAIAGRK